MKKIYSIDEIRAAERRAMEGGVDEITLMERAGRGLAAFASEKLSALGEKNVLFVCGGGNNGVDGFCAARLLSQMRKDVSVKVLLLTQKFSPSCQKMRALYRGEILTKIPKAEFPLIVECLMGTGMHGAPEGEVLNLINYINHTKSYVISLDLPAGLGGGGVIEGAAVRANCTLSVGAEKEELCLASGADVAGKVFPLDISLPLEGGADVFEEEDIKKFFPQKKSHVNKGSFGRALIFAESCAYPNAPLFSAEGCLTSGAGYTVLLAGDPLFSAAIGRTCAMLKKFEGMEDCLAANAVALGMGAGRSEKLKERIEYLLEYFEGVLVLDADALNVCALDGPQILKKRKKCRLVLTPHIGEFARLTRLKAEKILKDPVALSLKFAREFDVTLLLKNNRTVITDGERVAVNLTGSPALAKGGSGDILSGLIAGTCARGVEPYFAGCVSSYLLGRAGEIAEEFFGDYAATPRDILLCLKRAVKALSCPEGADGNGEA